MALTNDSFRDPRKLFPVRVLSGFFIEGRKPAEVGEIVTLSRSKAAEMVHAGKAERYVEPAPAPAAAPSPEAPGANAPGRSTKQSLKE